MKKSFFWNSLAGAINAAQSALILMLIARFYDESIAGIFSFAYAFSLLGMTVGKYGVRTYQSTDVDEKFCFSDYYYSRLVSLMGSLILLLMYLYLQNVVGNYSKYKTIIVLLLYLWKQVDVVEDLYYGRYQQLGRLDVGAKYYSIRLIVSTLFFSILLVCKIPFQRCVILTLLVSILIAFFLITYSKKEFSCIVNKGKYNYRILLKECFPLCVATTLAIVTGNLPKYMIDIFLNENIQAIFNYVMMPSFVIMLLSNFIFQPLIRGYGVLSLEKKWGEIRKGIRHQLLIIFIITLFVSVVSWFFGIPFLSVIFNKNLTEYKGVMFILIIGGGFYAISNYLMIPLTALRLQKNIMFAYVFALLVGILSSIYFVPTFGIMGATITYIIMNIALCLVLIISEILFMRKYLIGYSKKQFR